MVADRRWWTVKQVAEFYGLSARSIYDAIAAGKLIAHRFGAGRGGVRIADADRIAWEEQCRDGEHVPAEFPQTLKQRFVTAELVEKHFGT